SFSAVDVVDEGATGRTWACRSAAGGRDPRTLLSVIHVLPLRAWLYWLRAGRIAAATGFRTLLMMDRIGHLPSRRYRPTRQKRRPVGHKENNSPARNKRRRSESAIPLKLA